MSSYNENLRSTLALSLQTQELEQKQIQSQRDAAMFTLYYAEGATIIANEQLEQAETLTLEKGNVKSQAVNNNNIAGNLLTSAAQASSYVSQSTSNTAICAANVQVAANAIIKLSSSVGGIYSIAHAADKGSEIDSLALEARRLIENTAAKAEEASEAAMRVTMKTSEVAAAAVLDKAKVTGSLMGNVLKMASDEYNAAWQLVANCNDNLAGVSAAEKQAEGDYKDLSIDFAATQQAYKTLNEGLNLNLTVSSVSYNQFRVHFKLLRSPFATNRKEPHYPVQQYYLILVKDSNKSIFNSFNAENLLVNGLHDAEENDTETNGNNKNDTTEKTDDPDKNTVQYVPFAITPHHHADRIVNPHMIQIGSKTYTLKDSDGDEVQLGTPYVVFVLGEYYPDYKKNLNTYDDFLSAPSLPFTLTNELHPVDLSDMTTKAGSAIFTVPVEPVPSADLEYRFMLLPTGRRIPIGLLNDKLFRNFLDITENMNRLAEYFQPEIGQIEAILLNARSALLSLQSRQSVLKTKKAGPHGLTSAEEQEFDTLSGEFQDQNTYIGLLQEQLKDVTEKAQRASKVLDATGSGSSLGFIFNQQLAEQVLPSNYIEATVLLSDVKPGTSKGKQHTAKSQQHEVSNHRLARIGPDATDIFGNLLMEQQTYRPVVLSVYKGVVNTLSMYTNSMSDVDKTRDYVYQSNTLILQQEQQ